MYVFLHTHAGVCNLKLSLLLDRLYKLLRPHSLRCLKRVEYAVFV